MPRSHQSFVFTSFGAKPFSTKSHLGLFGHVSFCQEIQHKHLIKQFEPSHSSREPSRDQRAALADAWRYAIDPGIAAPSLRADPGRRLVAFRLLGAARIVPS